MNNIMVLKRLTLCLTKTNAMGLKIHDLQKYNGRLQRKEIFERSAERLEIALADRTRADNGAAL